MTTSFTLTQFTPAEAERISGLSTAMQRDWRHRGFLPKNEGHARFDAFGLASMMILKLFSDRGIGPQVAQEFMEITARGVVWFALDFNDAFEGDVPDVPDAARRGLWNSLGFPRMFPTRFLIVFNDGSEWWDTSVDKAIKANHTPEKLSGPLIILDLETLGDLLAERAGRPLVHVEATPDRPS